MMRSPLTASSRAQYSDHSAIIPINLSMTQHSLPGFAQ